MDNATKPIWKEKDEAGCEWYGRKIPGIPERSASRFNKYGLDFCHIITRENAPAQEWNGFVLCPTCHRLFDEVIKPKIIHALETAVSGFPELPTNPGKRYVSAHTYKEAVQFMSHRPIAVVEPEAELEKWGKKKPDPEIGLPTVTMIPC